MPYNRPIPDSNPRKKGSALVDSMVQAEKLIQIALLLPCAAFIGWLGGAWLDHVFHQTWITMAGVVFGILAGLIGAVRLIIKIAGGQGEGKSGAKGEDKQ
ncbi:MAG: AtpZ/AtpI family protein [Terracidiphilus sp.]